jgi:hypothetical protein
MQELRLVAVSEDGSYAVLAVPGRGGRFSLPIDDRLRTVARGQFSRLAQYEIEVESPLRPKEIQDRIRAGETADEIADAAGVPIERVRRFEGPVLAEREYRAQEAQRATVRGQGESGPGPRLGDIVAERLPLAGASAEDAQWDSRKRPDGNWQVQLMFTISGRPQMAEWVFDPRRRHATPADDQAVMLCLPETDWPAGRFVARGPATATVTPIGSRLGTASAHHPEQHGEPERRAEPERRGERRAEPERRATRGTAVVGGSVAGAPDADGSAAGSPAVSRSERAGGAAAAATHRPAPAVARARPAAHPPAAGPATGRAAGDPEGLNSAERPTADELEEREKAASPARRAAGGRSRRSSVPSWDEIMFGNTRQSD